MKIIKENIFKIFLIAVFIITILGFSFQIGISDEVFAKQSSREIVSAKVQKEAKSKNNKSSVRNQKATAKKKPAKKSNTKKKKKRDKPKKQKKKKKNKKNKSITEYMGVKVKIF